MKTTSEETEKTETETKTKSETAHHNKEAETAIFPSDKELAAHGFYSSKGLFQDFKNISLAPTAGSKFRQLVNGASHVVLVWVVAGDAYDIGKWCLVKLAARKAAAKAASKLTGLEVGDSAEVAMTATAAWY